MAGQAAGAAAKSVCDGLPPPMGAPSPEGTGVPVRALRGIAPLSLLAGEFHSPAGLLGGDQVTRQRTTPFSTPPFRRGGRPFGPFGGVPQPHHLSTTRIWTNSLYFKRILGSPGTLTIIVAP